MPDRTDPGLDVRCRACLSERGEACIGTTSDLPRERVHRLRPLAASPRLVHCAACEGSGWQRIGFGVTTASTACPVCGAAPFAVCTEGGAERGTLHTVRARAAAAGLRPCLECDAVGWLPDEAVPAEVRTPRERVANAANVRPQDVPSDLVEALFDAAEAADMVMPRIIARQLLADLLPRTYRYWFAAAFGTPEEIAAREAKPRTPDDPVRLCEMARPGEHVERVLTAAADQLDAMPETDGAALKGPYWYRQGFKDAIHMLRDWADYPPVLADRITRGDTR